jgi:flagellar biosynthesis protein FlhG
MSANILTIASGKGGVGKTWLATTLSHALAREGQRVLLFDGDLGLANVDVQIGLTPGRDLGSVIAGRATLEQAITHFAGGAAARGGFDVLAGRSGSGALGALSPGELEILAAGLTKVAGGYDVTVADLAAGVDTAVLTLARASRSVIVVLTDEPTSLTDAYAFIKLMSQRRPDCDINIVVNMAASAAEARRTHAALTRACHSFLGMQPPLLGFVPRDHRVKDAIRHQTPLLTRHPQSPAANAVVTLARTLAAASGRPAHVKGAAE